MITLDDLRLPDQLVWQDEREWSGVFASVRRTLQGKRIVQRVAAVGESGRMITLGAEQSAWITRADLDTLQAMSEDPSRELLLTLHNGTSYKVIFRHQDSPVLEVEPVQGYSNPPAGAWYNITALKLEVAS